MVAISFENQVGDGHKEQHQRGRHQTDRNLLPANPDIAGMLIFLIVAFETQHRDSQRLQKETPNHAKRIGLAQHVKIAAAGDEW